MAWDSIITTVSFTTGLLILYLHTFVKSTVQESVKHEFENQRERMREEFEREQEARERRDKFRLAALEKRLEVHQRAFALARRMIFTLHDSAEKNSVATECKTFWDGQSLYLSNDVRREFHKSYLFYNFYDQEIESIRSLKEADPESAKKAHQELIAHTEELRQLPALIENAVDLEAMGNEDGSK